MKVSKPLKGFTIGGSMERHYEFYFGKFLNFQEDGKINASQTVDTLSSEIPSLKDFVKFFLYVVWFRSLLKMPDTYQIGMAKNDTIQLDFKL